MKKTAFKWAFRLLFWGGVLVYFAPDLIGHTAIALGGAFHDIYTGSVELAKQSAKQSLMDSINPFK